MANGQNAPNCDPLRYQHQNSGNISNLSLSFPLEDGTTSTRIPVVCIVIEGGKNTIKTAEEAVENKTPVIIIANTGRAANVMAHFFER